ncbi:MAG TPA: N-formylglutamate amidohydrolase, partial [Acidocella sp.]|nr:N-formylglutamate amidohydrolase [Acidocella sp.]
MCEIAPFSLIQPQRQRVPLVLTSPHSGRIYTEAFLARSRLDARAIRRSEDSFVEELFAAAPDLGVPLLAAQFPRAWCDANREAWELDPGMFADELPDYVNTTSPRVRAGLGTVARIVGAGEPIYAQKLMFAEAQARIETCWKPFHAALEGLIEATLARFGVCLVIDCHSMPTLPGRQNVKADIVLGDGYGTSCAPDWTDLILSSLATQGLRARRNEPYAGGYITRHYGRPREGVQVVQIEVARGLYMNEKDFSRSAQFVATQEKMTAFLAAVVEVAEAWMAAHSNLRSA